MICCVPYPFVRSEYQDADGEWTTCWRPGTEQESVYHDDSRCVAAAMGSMVITEISAHKPSGYPERVFYVRTWVDPDGRAFGKRRCRITTRQAFSRLLKGYRYEYEIEPSWTMVTRTKQESA